MINVILFCLLIEALVGVFKCLAGYSPKRVSEFDMMAVIIGVVLCVVLRIDLFGCFPDSDFWWKMPDWVDYIFFVITGIGLGRGASFLYNLWHKPWVLTFRVEQNKRKEATK